MSQRLQRYGLLRLFVVLVVVAIGYGTRWAIRENATAGPFVALAALTALVASVASWWGRRATPGPVFVAANLAWDVFFASALCYLTGASYSLGQLVFLGAIAAGAWLGGTPAALGTAAASSVGLVAALFLSGSPPTDREAQIVFFTEAMFRVFGFFLMALGSGYLNESLRREQRSSALLGAQHEVVLDRVRAGVVTVDPAGRVLGVNPAGRALLGDSVGQPITAVMPGFASRADGTWEEAFADGRRWVCSVGTLPEGGDVVVIEDVTELVRMREERQRAERLLGAGRFAAGLAHEIRNPLASISGCLQMLEEEKPSTLLTLALSEAGRLNRLVDDFLSVSKPPALDRRAADVAELVREVAQTFAQDARYRGVVEVSWTGASAPAWVDPDRLRQALWNLILNGAQALPGGGRISLATTDRVGDGHGGLGVEVVVRDDGVGISEEDRARVFDPLFTRRAGGTGLGLAVVDHVVRAHGGRIEIESPEEGGTMFRMWLPKEVEGAR